jgi:RNA polymerase sigma-70 factor (ECF subfamily)
MQQQAEQGLHDDAALYDHYAHVIFAYIRLHLSSREDAEDLTLEVFLAALERDNLSALAEGEKLAWLRRVAHNKLIDRYRRLTHRPIVALDEVADTLYDDQEMVPEQIALRNEEYTHLRATLRRLPILQQQLLRLRYGDGLRFAEIAVILNKREGALRKLLSRTLACLRSTYDQQPGGDVYGRQ